MMKCPKCGFEQPPDKYCANCGIDVELYSARAPIKRAGLRGSSGFYLFLIAVVLSATGYYFYHQKGLLKESDSITAPSPSQKSVTTIKPSFEKKQVAAPDLTSTQEKLNAEPVAELKARPSATMGFADATPTRPDTIVFHALQIPQEKLATLYQNLVTFEGAAGIIPNVEDRLKELQTGSQVAQILTTLSKSITTQTLNLDQNVNDNTGLFIRVNVDNVTDTSALLSIRIESRFPNAQGVVQSIEHGGDFNIQLKQGAFFTNLLPHIQNLDEDDSALLARHPLLKVLTFPSHQSNRTEFVAIFELKN